MRHSLRVGPQVVLAVDGTPLRRGGQAPGAENGIPGLVVSQSGTIYVDGVQIAKGTQPAWSPDGSQIALERFGEIHVIGVRELGLGVSADWK